MKISLIDALFAMIHKLGNTHTKSLDEEFILESWAEWLSD